MNWVSQFNLLSTALKCAPNPCYDTEVICTSHCNASESGKCKLGTQCGDGKLIPASRFCDFTLDCSGYNDEYDFVVTGIQCNGIRGVCYLL